MVSIIIHHSAESEDRSASLEHDQFAVTPQDSIRDVIVTSAVLPILSPTSSMEGSAAQVEELGDLHHATSTAALPVHTQVDFVSTHGSGGSIGLPNKSTGPSATLGAACIMLDPSVTIEDIPACSHIAVPNNDGSVAGSHDKPLPTPKPSQTRYQGRDLVRGSKRTLSLQRASKLRDWQSPKPNACSVWRARWVSWQPKSTGRVREGKLLLRCPNC